MQTPYQAPLNTIVLNPELNEITRFGNDGFTIVPKIKDEKEFSFMIQKGKMKVDDIIEKREEWVAVSIFQLFTSEYSFVGCNAFIRGWYRALNSKQWDDFVNKQLFVIACDSSFSFIVKFKLLYTLDNICI